MRRAVVLLALLATLLGLGAASAAAAEWHSEQPSGPGGKTLLGKVGDLQCWQANRCVLITQGNGGVPAGVYAYDGTEWHLYSTVCGGHNGSIAWAGPNEFWTVSDMQSGQQASSESEPWQVSLCHFKDGAVVASYAEPLGVATSYLKMNAAACLGPDECWFAGQRLPGTTNVGAFHLYWNGITLRSVPSLTHQEPEIEDPGREVVGLAYHAGALYEGVRAQATDEAPGESPEAPVFLHRVLPGEPAAFEPVLPASPIAYGEAGAGPGNLQGFQLSDDGEGLWAVSGAKNPGEVTVLRLAGSSFEQLSLDDPSEAFNPGTEVGGLAAEPGAAAAWVGFTRRGEGFEPKARLALVHADGHVDPPIALPEAGEGVGLVGTAGPIDCPAPGQCWMATQKGWLFHLGPDLPRDEDPAMHALIAFRPPDNSVPSLPPLTLPEDNSGAAASKGEEEAFEIQQEPLPKRKPALLTKLHQRLLGGNVLELTFVLRARVHIQLIARRHGKVVAKTKRLTMGRGPGKLRLQLDPKRWPTKLDLQVHPASKAAGK
jgi:hypothetical protein